MGQRSPHNARYQKYTKPGGKTRRSAASAKPKREVGKAGESTSSSKKSTSGRGGYAVPQTPEYRKWRNVWWATLGASAACALIYLALAKSIPAQAKFALLLGCYVFLGIGMYLDWRKVRPAREAALRGESGTKPTKKVDKPTDASAG